MHICYVDESGDVGMLPTATSPVQPVFAIAGIIVDATQLARLNSGFLQLKRRFFPGRIPPATPFLDSILTEVKGSTLRTDFRSGGRNPRRHVTGFVDHSMRLLEQCGCSIVGRVWIKGVAQPFNGRSVYTYSVQAICESFQSFLHANDSHGLIIADSRAKGLNTTVAHSVFTQKFKTGGDSYSRLLELPAFGHSENHASIQLADLLCSTLLFPIAAATYCDGVVDNVHVNAGYSQLKSRFGRRLEDLQYRFRDAAGRMRGGITVSDQLRQWPSSRLFR